MWKTIGPRHLRLVVSNEQSAPPPKQIGFHNWRCEQCGKQGAARSNNDAFEKLRAHICMAKAGDYDHTFDAARYLSGLVDFARPWLEEKVITEMLDYTNNPLGEWLE